MVGCERAGVKRFFVRSELDGDQIRSSMGRFAGNPDVQVVGSFDELTSGPNPVDHAAPCLSIAGNLVLSPWLLKRMLKEAERNPDRVCRTLSADPERGGSIATGPLAELICADAERAATTQTAHYLPFALNGRPEDLDEAEVRLARSLKQETTGTDAFLARHVDRNLSWRISLRLARIRGIKPNHVTLANTAFGMLCAWMFATPSYWVRLAGAILFVLSITIDGVDGELARLTMTESNFGRLLDTITDNIVHVAVFVGIFVGCYRASGSVAYVYLLPILLIGFSLCALATFRALRVRGDDAAEWLAKVDRISGRDFAYLLVVLAAINRLNYFAWGAAVGTYVFAFVLLWITQRRWGRAQAGVIG